MIDLRSHIASLIAVFLALGIGIVIGSSFGSPAVLRHWTQLIKDSDIKLDAVLVQQTQDEQLLGSRESALNSLIPRFTHDMLTGDNVAIVRLGDYPDAETQAINAVTAANGTVVSVTSVLDRFGFSTDADRLRLQGKIDSMDPNPQYLRIVDETTDQSQHDKLSADLFRPLVEALQVGAVEGSGCLTAIQLMEAKGMLSYTGSFDQPVSYIVIVGGSSSPPEQDLGNQFALEGQFITLLDAGDTTQSETLVGCEPLIVTASSIPVYQAAGISSVDCIDESVGQLDLVYALHGDKNTYGMKATADHLLPEALETPILSQS